MLEGKSYITADEQIGLQIRTARDRLNMSRRALSLKAGVSSPTMKDYEEGKTAPAASMLAKIAEALEIRAFEIDEYRYTITRKEKVVPTHAGEQLTLDFAGEYAFSRATVRISPGRINVSFDGITLIPAVTDKAAG
jgi:transcriptional regulator with XRE-family HTH domain